LVLIQKTCQTPGLHPSQSSSAEIQNTSPSLISTTLLIQKKNLHIERCLQTGKQGYVDYVAFSLSTTSRNTTSKK
jgi:hypothetical protein